MVMPTAVVLVVLLLILLLVVGAAYITRHWPVPLRDSDLPTTTPLDGGPPLDDLALDTRPGVERTPWANTEPSGPMPLDEAPTPWDRAVQTMNAKESKP